MSLNPSPNTQEPEAPGQEKINVQVETKTKFTLPLPFCSFQVLSGLNDTQSLWLRQSLINLLIQMLITSQNILTDMPRNCLNSCLSPLPPISLHIQLTIIGTVVEIYYSYR